MVVVVVIIVIIILIVVVVVVVTMPDLLAVAFFGYTAMKLEIRSRSLRFEG